MRKSVLIVLLAIVILGGWFGYRELRRQRFLSSEQDVLLINKSAGLYTYTSLLDREDITRAFKPVGYAQDMTQERTEKYIEGLRFFGAKNPPIPQVSVEQPDQSEATAWSAALALISQGQKDLCAQIQRADFAQACVFRHYMLQLSASGNIAGCDAIFVDSFREECRRIIGENQLSGLTDNDNDSFIDLYEFYANPDSFDPDPLG